MLSSEERSARKPSFSQGWGACDDDGSTAQGRKETAAGQGMGTAQGRTVVTTTVTKTFSGSSVTSTRKTIGLPRSQSVAGEHPSAESVRKVTPSCYSDSQLGIKSLSLDSVEPSDVPSSISGKSSSFEFLIERQGRFRI